jgi:hypothetical protein
VITIQLQKSFNAVVGLKNYSGLNYDDKDGCNINVIMENTWDIYMKISWSCTSDAPYTDQPLEKSSHIAIQEQKV